MIGFEQKKRCVRPPAQHTTQKISIQKKIANFSLSVNYYQTQTKSNPPKRSPIKRFSDSSFRRLKNTVLSIKEQPTLFITLTYPSVFPTARESKAHLNSFLSLFSYHYPDAWAVWKLEPQERGAPHFHLLVGNIHLSSSSSFYSFVNFISFSWYRIVGSGDINHLRVGTQVVNLEYNKYRNNLKKSVDYVSIYLVKYFSKSYFDSSLWSFPGRFWGIVGRKNITLESHYFSCSLDFFYKYRRLMRKRIKKYLLHKKTKINKSSFMRGNFSIIYSDFKSYVDFLYRLSALFDEPFSYNYSSSNRSPSYLDSLFLNYDDNPL